MTIVEVWSENVSIGSRRTPRSSGSSRLVCPKSTPHDVSRVYCVDATKGHTLPLETI